MAAIAATVLPTSAMAQQPRSIVGDWTTAGQACTPLAGAISIKPMSLSADEMSCTFTSVRREGATVIWRGACENSADERSSGTLRATEANGRLTIVFPNGVLATNLVRCRAR
jgi:hypothetical protein